ncbi:MAG: hypothetical protein ACRDTH_24435 [Pseudonocardiaceae bacterium]
MTDIVVANPDNFRIVGPEETALNQLQAVFDVTDRQFWGELQAGDEHATQSGRVLEALSEHLGQGWLEGYLLTGRHGIFNATRRSSTSWVWSI